MSRTLVNNRTSIPFQQNFCINSNRWDIAPGSGTAWTNGDLFATANAAIAPDGSNTACSLVDDAVNTFHFFFQNTAPDFPKIVRCASVYVKPASKHWFFMGVNDTSDGVYFDVLNGIKGTTIGVNVLSTGIIPVTSVPGWYRIWIVFLNMGGIGTTWYFQPTIADNVDQYAGDGSIVGYVWNAQQINANWPGFPTVTTLTNLNIGTPRNTVINRKSISNRKIP